MPLNRAIEGAINTGQLITWTQEDGTAQDLTGATLSGTIEDVDGSTTAIAGTLTATDETNGIFSWEYAAGDVDTVGRFMVQFKADYGGGSYDLSYAEVWIVERAL